MNADSTLAWRMPNGRQLLGLILAAVSMCWLSPLASSGDVGADDLHYLAGLSGDEYVLARDRLLAKPTDLSLMEGEIVALDWPASLMHQIINARLAHRDSFADWQNLPILRTRGGGYNQHPVTASIGEREGADWFVIEQAWKGLWPDEMKQATVEALIERRISGPPQVWRKVAEKTDRDALRAIALGALTQDESAEAILRAGLLDDKSSELARRAIFEGLRINAPVYTARLIESSELVWEANPLLARSAMRALATHPGTESRNLLRAYITDKDLAPGIRREALGAMSVAPRAGDLDVLRAALNDSEEVIRLASGTALRRYELTDIRPLIQQTLENSTDLELIHRLVQVVERNGKAEDAGLLDAVRSRQDVSQELRNQVEKAQQSLLSKTKP